MNYIIAAMVAFTLIPIVLGVLLGLLRGWRRSVLRLGLVILSIILAVVLCGAVANSIFDMSIPGVTEEGATISDMVQEMISESMPIEGLGDTLMGIIVPLAQSIIKVVIFLPLFALLLFLTWAIVYPICKIFVKPKKVTNSDGKVVKKKGILIGSAIGLVQGVIVAVCVGIVLTGLLVQVNKVMVMANDLSSLGDSVQEMALSDGDDNNVEYAPDDGYTNNGDGSADLLLDVIDMIGEYTDSGLGKFYYSIGEKPFNWLSEVKTDDGKITLASQIDTVRGMVDMASEFAKLQDIDFENLFDAGNVDSIRDIFNSLQAINENLSKESKETIKNVLNSVGEEMGLPVDFSDIDLDNVDFSKEGEIFTELLDYNNKEEITPDDAQHIIEKMAESDLILDVLESQDNVNIGSNLNGEHRDAIEEKLEEMETSGRYDQSKLEAIRKIFGLKSNDDVEE